MTDFQYRILIVVPVAKVAAVVTWFQNNIDSNFDVNIGPPLNPSGLFADAITHRWCSGAFTAADTLAIMIKMCNLASVTPPTMNQWNGWTKVQKLAFVQGVQAAVFAGFGIWVDASSNDNTWDNPQDALTALGLKVRAAA